MFSTAYLDHLILKRAEVESFARYPFNLPVVRDLEELAFHPKITFFVGENGSGKSTLLEAIAVAMGLNPEGGTNNFNFSTRASHSELHRYLRLSKGMKRPETRFFFRAESFFNLATQVEELGFNHCYGHKSLHEQSHGESFLALVMNRFEGKGFYILDEPEAALSPTRQLSVLTRIHDLIEDQSQFIIATHSPILMAYPGAWIYSCGSDGIRRIEYEETEHYRVTRDFLKNPERMLRILFEKEQQELL